MNKTENITINYKNEYLDISFTKEIFYFENSNREIYRKISNIKINNKIENLEQKENLAKKIIKNVKHNNQLFMQTKNQHFLPQFIQRHWAINRKANNNNKKVKYIEINDEKITKKEQKIENMFTSEFTFNLISENSIYYFEEGIISLIENAVLNLTENYKKQNLNEKDATLIFCYALMNKNEFNQFLEFFIKDIKDNIIDTDYFLHILKMHFFNTHSEQLKGYNYILLENKNEILPLFEDWAIPFFSSMNILNYDKKNKSDFFIIPLNKKLFIFIYKKKISQNCLQKNIKYIEYLDEYHVLGNAIAIQSENSKNKIDKKLIITSSNEFSLENYDINYKDAFSINDDFLSFLKNNTTNKDKLIDHYNKYISRNSPCAQLNIVDNKTEEIVCGPEMFIYNQNDEYFYIGDQIIYLKDLNNGFYEEVKHNFNNNKVKARCLFKLKYERIKEIDFSREFYEKPVAKYDFEKRKDEPDVFSYVLKIINYNHEKNFIPFGKVKWLNKPKFFYS